MANARIVDLCGRQVQIKYHGPVLEGKVYTTKFQTENIIAQSGFGWLGARFGTNENSNVQVKATQDDSRPDPAVATWSQELSPGESGQATVDGRNPAPPKKPWETMICWYLQGNHHSRVSLAVQNFVHPQY